MRFQKTNWMSRRTFLPLIASAILSPAAVNPAQAQTEPWQLYRRDDAGFEIEMPGEPTTWPDVQNPTSNASSWTRSIEAHLEHEKILFGTLYFEYHTLPSMDFLSRVVREHALLAGRKLTRETALLIHGLPAAEFVSESDKSTSIERVVILRNGTINLGIHGDTRVGDSPLARRLFDSFKPLAAN